MIFINKGRSGTGKTKYLHELFQRLSNDDEKLLFIVPDNATFDTQNTFYDELGPKDYSKVFVCGFTILCDHVFEVCGLSDISFADEGVRHVVMNMAIDSCKKKLDLFKSRAKSKDLCELMLSTLKDLKLRSVTVDDLLRTSEMIDDKKLKSKLTESAEIFKAYNAYFSLSYIDPFDRIERASGLIEKEKLFEGYTIAVDSHKAFNRQQYALLKVLMKQCKDIYFSINADDENVRPGELFYTNSLMEANLLELAKESGQEQGFSDFRPVQQRFFFEDLKTVEENVYRRKISTYDGECDNIVLYRALSIYDESDFVARTVRRLVIENDYRYKDIAVITRHPEKYMNILDLAFEKYRVSYFISKSQNIDSKPLVRFITSVFDIVNDGYSKDDILTLLKTGLTVFTSDEISVFENYVFMWDINFKGFFKEFKQNPRGFEQEFTDEDTENLKTCEKIRSDLISKLKAFDEKTKNVTGLEMSQALMELLFDLKVDENINRLCDEMERKEIHSGEDLFRMWNLLIEIIEKTVDVTKDYRFSRRRFSELIYTHISNSDISYIPSGIDQVTLYDVSNLSFNDKKVVFVIGCNEGEFPYSEFESGLFSDDECKTLMSYDLEVGDTIEQKASSENMYVYAALTRATEKLYISRYKQELSGDALEESSIFTELYKACSKLKTMDYDDLSCEDHLYSDESAFEYLTENFSRIDEDQKLREIEKYFEKKEKYSDILKLIKENNVKKSKKIEDEQLSKELFGKKLTLSASQVDKFHLCKFEYFIKYGLRIEERKKAVIDSLQYGTLMHYVLESFIKNHKNDDFKELKKKDIEKETDEIFDVYLRVHLGGEEDKSERFMYLYGRMKKTAKALLLHVVKELSQSDFRPVDFELGIGSDIPSYEIKIDDELSLSVIGSIDRVDVYERGNDTFIRIIDYKTGTKNFSLSDIYYGINLQMLIYMSAVEKNGSAKYGDNIIPAGVLYTPAKNPLVKVYDDDQEKLDAEKDKELKMQGVILDNSEIIKAMEKEVKGVYIPVKYSSSGKITPSNAMNLASLSEFGLLSKKIDSLLTNMAKTLRKGEIDDVPAKGRYDGCEWCPYMSVCTHKETDPFIGVKTMKKEEFYGLISKDEGGDENV